jgi:hypothetical protein
MERPIREEGNAMSSWFEGQIEIECDVELIKRSLDDPGEHFVGIVRHMPGLTSVDLVEQGDGVATIRTNEGLMTRSTIDIQVEDDRVVVEFDEEYEAGNKMTARSHYRDEFTSTDSGVRYQTTISGVEAPGVLGFFYRTFGSSSIGKAVLKATRQHFGGPSDAP